MAWPRSTEPVPLVVDPQFGERSPALSPDGRWLAYESNESGRVEVYVRPFPNANEGRWLVSTGGGVEPVWCQSGRELFYRSGDDELVAVQVRQQAGSGASFAWDRQEKLFSVDGYLAGNGHPMYDVSPDDQRFVMLRIGGYLSAGTELIMVDNFFEELKQLAQDRQGWRLPPPLRALRKSLVSHEAWPYTLPPWQPTTPSRSSPYPGRTKSLS